MTNEEFGCRIRDSLINRLHAKSQYHGELGASEILDIQQHLTKIIQKLIKEED